jgi:hypothetical membrane protein
VTIGASCWVLGLEYLVGQAIAQAASKAPYSLSGNRLSDLGVTTCGHVTILGSSLGYLCSPLHQLYNASSALLGVLTLAGAILTWPAWPRRRLSTWGLIFLCLLGVGRVVAGLNPENVRAALHALGALTSIPSGALAMLLLGIAVFPARRVLGTVSVVLGAVGVVAFVVMASPDYGPLGGGGDERLAVEPFVAWLAGVGISMLAMPRSWRLLTPT